MNIIELLKEQHRQVRGIFERINLEDRKQRRSLVAELSKALRSHLQIEEKFVYPAAQKAFQGDEEDEQRMLVSYEEHAAARGVLGDLETASPSDKRFIARAKVLAEIVEKHIEEEESEIFPEMRAKMGEEALAKLGDQVERRLAALESEAERPSPRAKRAAVGRPRGRGPGARARATARGGARATGRRRATKTSTRAPRRAPSGNGNGGQTRPRRGESTSRS